MKKLILLSFLVLGFFVFAQGSKIYPKNAKIKIGDENTYVYETPRNLLIPEGSKVICIFKWISKTAPLEKEGNQYIFKMKIPIEHKAALIVITDAKGKPVDNNEGKGFTQLLINNKNGEAESEALANYNLAEYLKLIELTTSQKIAMYEMLFKKYPVQKTKASYVSYLLLKNEIAPEKTKIEMLAFANLSATKSDEKSLMNAINLYRRLKMSDKSELVFQKILKLYPKGEVAKGFFYQELYGLKEKDETILLEKLKEYQAKFNDTTSISKQGFYSLILSKAINDKDENLIKKYENLISEKMTIAGTYNQAAWELSGQDLSSEGKDLDFAEKISRKSVEFVKQKLDKGYSDEFQGALNMYADTLALILFKKGKYDEAFNYQEEIRLVDGLDEGGLERYAAYAEKAKGDDFTKKIVEEELLKKGYNSMILLNQLQEIYQRLNLPLSQFEKIKEEVTSFTSRKLKEQLVKTFGDIKSKDFELTNLDGKKVKLSNFKGKMIVLDFWATWCGPCRASFPNMKKLVETYKGDNVEFLFINTWENKKPAEVKKDVSKFIADNKYPFNVLFDYEDKVVKDYKVQGIPTKIVIDKNGEIISINSSDDNLKALIEENK